MSPSPAEILARSHTIALVGASPRPERPSNSVMAYLLREGYRVIPVRPVGPPEILGQRRVASLAEIEEPIDLVDVFRRSEAAGEFADQAVAVGAKGVWFQLGVIDADAFERTTGAGVPMVMDTCPAIEWSRRRR